MNNEAKIRSPFYPSVFELTDEDIDWIESRLSEMTLKEKCAQMIMPWALGKFANEGSPGYKRIERLVKDLKVGGLIFFKGNVLSEAALINKMQALSDIPLLMAADFERGLAMRIDDATQFPYNMALAATGDLNLAYEMGRVVAVETKALGVHQNYAPVADINNNAENPIINIRSYSEDKAMVSEFCANFIEGTNRERIISTAKHFPGHGNTNVDSHKELPMIKGSRESLFKNELEPFVQSIKAGVKSIMVGHLAVPSLEPSPGLPATLSEKIITELLKGELGFDGLVVTDAMNMSAVTKYFSVAEAAVLAVKAGNDILLMPPDEEVAINAVAEVVEKGKIEIAQIDRSVRKILSAKRWLQIEENKFSNTENLMKIIGQNPHWELAGIIAEKSITLVKNENNVVPVNSASREKIACITLTDEVETNQELYFNRILRDNYFISNSLILNKKSMDKDYAKALKTAHEAELVLLPCFVHVKAYQGTVQLSKKHQEFINKVLKSGAKAVLISFGNPYLLSLFPDAGVYLCAYGDVPASQSAVLKALFGEIDIVGRLPVAIPNSNFSIGHGIKLLKHRLAEN